MMDNELKELLNSIQGELNSIKKELADNREEMKVINYKLDRNTEKIDDLGLDMKVMERNIRRDIRKLSDDNDTIIEVLKQRDFIPR